MLLVELAELHFILNHFALFDRSFARLDHYVRLEVQNRLEVAQRDVEDVPNAARQALEEPHMRARRRQLDVSQELAPDFRQCHLDAALVADHAAVLHALVLAAQALPVGDRAEDARAEQAITLGLERAVVDSLRLGYLAVRPAADLLRRCQADADRVEVGNRVSEFKWIRSEQVVLPRPLRGRWRLPDFTSVLRVLPPAGAVEAATPILKDQSAAMGSATSCCLLLFVLISSTS